MYAICRGGFHDVIFLPPPPPQCRSESSQSDDGSSIDEEEDDEDEDEEDEQDEPMSLSPANSPSCTQAPPPPPLPLDSPASPAHWSVEEVSQFISSLQGRKLFISNISIFIKTPSFRNRLNVNRICINLYTNKMNECKKDYTPKLQPHS